MMGKWQGYGLQTNHPIDGLLELWEWYGKEFIDPEKVHPQLIAIAPNPLLIKLGVFLKFPKFKFLNFLFRVTYPLPRVAARASFF